MASLQWDRTNRTRTQATPTNPIAEGMDSWNEVVQTLIAGLCGIVIFGLLAIGYFWL